MGAGGIVVRGGPRPLIALVQRRKDDAWVLPKGKLKRKEEPIAAAEREVVEETGYTVEIREYLGAISYKAGRKPKLVEFWRMQAVARSAASPPATSRRCNGCRSTRQLPGSSSRW